MWVAYLFLDLGGTDLVLCAWVVHLGGEPVCARLLLLYLAISRYISPYLPVSPWLTSAASWCARASSCSRAIRCFISAPGCAEG